MYMCIYTYLYVYIYTQTPTLPTQANRGVEGTYLRLTPSFSVNSSYIYMYIHIIYINVYESIFMCIYTCLCVYIYS